jgi:N-acetylglucosamine-6-phosphate deacetylase
MPPVGGAKREFNLQGSPIMVRDGRCATPEGVLAGSSIGIATAVGNSVRLLGTPLEQALRLAGAEPADFLGLGHWLGRLAPGYRADIVAFEPSDMTVSATWVAGKRSDA